ncbi:hypothetical protein FOVG_04386 [Fusarium oxysporum f. sp. pisi HDV247]|uniref:Uncharacterized protein n=1 Tax=Fusarium oxysporum f. sp. pisi HDV247 TaxID=1080344 RepID=W9PVV6_FUSOX|nr:hypothetical protein FOVG_04386 [Fusarium oxysporum f. sp. pisi HDV247]
MLFAETTHEMTDNLILTTVESSIDGLYTPEGHSLTENKELDAENEVLGFDVGRQWGLEPAGDDDKGMSNGYLMEEHEMTRRWHDHAVLLIPKEGLLDLVRPDGGQNTSRRPVRSTRDQETHHPGMTPVVAMVVDDLEKNPGGTVKVAENIIDELCDSGNDTQVLCTCINPIVNWCLRSGYMPLYTTAFRKPPITVVHVLAEYIAKNYQGSEDSIDWKEWLDDIIKKPIRRFGISYRDFSRTILAVSPIVWKSFDAWSETIMDEKLDSELSWEYKDLEMILDLIRLRCDNTHWIVNRVTKTAAQAQPDLRSLVFNYSGLEKVLQPLREHFMRKALGEQRYREIILLEGVTPYGPPLNSAEVRGPPTGDGSQPGKRLCTSEMGAIDRGLPYNQTAGQTEAGNV